MKRKNRKRVEIIPKKAPSYLNDLSSEISKCEEIQFSLTQIGRLYKVEGGEFEDKVLLEVFSDPVTDNILLEHQDLAERIHFDYLIEKSFRPGVTDNSGRSASEALRLFGHESDVFSGHLYFVQSDVGINKIRECAEKYLGNNLIEDFHIYPKKELSNLRFKDVALPHMIREESPGIKLVDLEVSDQNLLRLSDENCWALNLKELHCIKEHYKGISKNRTRMKLPLKPTDVEIEVIAQTWSEHCKHKIFAADIEYREISTDGTIKKERISSLYKTYIKDATKEIKEERSLTWLKSVFSDNAGIVSYDKNVDLCIKVETHNSPSALDPYGGALTGILGVNRDILGCGLGARPIANTDVFCFADPKLPTLGEEIRLPAGLLNPAQILKGVHKGVEDGGNKSGVPTVNGSMYFDNDYAGKPLVFVGTVGVMPKELPDGRKVEEKSPCVGDKIIMLGGEIGADGIHGATFSSLELNESSPLSAVQIGDPLTQKRVMDFLMVARDLGLYTSITDNGAGGLSSSVGEMAEATNGANLYLDRCPFKYPGLSCYEAMISESQERMTLSVEGYKVDEFLELAKKWGVKATDIGEFTDSGQLNIYWKDELAGSLNLEFLHSGLPTLELEAIWDGQDTRLDWYGNQGKKLDRNKRELDLEAILSKLLSSPNIASKEHFVRQYDHEVQGATHVKPFVGIAPGASGVNNAGGIWLYPHGGEENNGALIGCGMNPRLSLYDPELMACVAVDESIRNIISHGADPDYISLLDNFCWPDPVQSPTNPKGAYRLGQLVRASKGLKKACLAFGAPLVSGKDSMKNNFRGKSRLGETLEIAVLPTLLVTSLGKYNLNHSVNSDFKKEGDLIYLLGSDSLGLLGSEFAEYYDIENKKLPSIDLEFNASLYREIHLGIKRGLLQSCHDISDGGMAVSLLESSFANMLGAQIDLSYVTMNPLEFLFSETPGRFVISVERENEKNFLEHFKNYGAYRIGSVKKSDTLDLKFCEKFESLNLNTLKKIWSGVFHE